MALPLACFSLCLLFFLLNFYFSCPNPSMCGDVEIRYPFFLNTGDHPSSTATTPDARTGKYSIRWDDDSVPWIKFNDDEYRVMSISYTEKVLILQDQALGKHLLQGKCGFLYNFTDPIPNFQIPPRSAALILLNSSVDCQSGTNAFSRACFPELNGSNHCNDYKLYYWDELNDHHVPASNNCSVAQPTLLEWKLSFDRDDGSLSLLSVGFSHTFELHKDCFYCQTTSQSCTGNNRTANSSYSYENICKHKGSGPWKKTTGIVPLLYTSTSRHNHFGHNRYQDPLTLHVFRGNVPLFYEESSQEHIDPIHQCSAATLRELIIDANFSIPKEDQYR